MAGGTGNIEGYVIKCREDRITWSIDLFDKKKMRGGGQGRSGGPFLPGVKNGSNVEKGKKRSVQEKSFHTKPKTRAHIIVKKITKSSREKKKN